MQQRHRSPGNGYRSRISPDYRYFNRRPTPNFHPPPPPPAPPPPPPAPPRKFDIFVEAGRLAAQYLASQGLLHHDRLVSNSNRTSVLARLGTTVSTPNSDAEADYESFRPNNLKSNVNSRRISSASSSSSSSYRGYGGGDGDGGRSYEYPRSGSFHDRLSGRDVQANPVSERQSLGDDRREENAEPEIELSSEEPQRRGGDCDPRDSSASVFVDRQDSPEPENDSSGDLPDLRTTLTMSTFAKVPTRTRSSKAPKIPKLDQASIPPEVEPEKNVSSSPANNEDDDDQKMSENASLSAPDEERSDKRAREEECEKQEGVKKPRDWPSSSSIDVDSGHYFEPHGVTETKPSSINHEDGGEAEFPCSFKICDLNLMEVSESHDHIKKESAVSVDVDLSMSNNDESIGESNRKEIEVIDLDNDSSPEDKDLSSIADTKTENVYNELDGYPNDEQNTGDISDAQDGYGLMISEYLENDFSNCSSVPQHIDPVHNDIGLHNGEGPAIGDDDSIYMSLGEIPLTYLRPWEPPPPQEFEKPF